MREEWAPLRKRGSFKTIHRVALTGLVAGALAVTAAGCASPQAAPDATTAATPKIAVFYLNGSSYGASTLEAAQEEGKKLGVEVVGFNGDNTAQTQAQQMQDATTSGQYDGYLVWALNAEALAPTVDAAVEAGIKVVTTDYTFGSLEDSLVLAPYPGLVTTVGQSLQDQIDGFADSIRAACAVQVGEGQPCNAAFMVGLSNYPTDTLRIEALKEIFATGPINLILTPPGEYDTPTSQKVGLTFFQSNPDIDVFHSFGDQMSAGVLTALDQLGIVPGKDIQVLGAGASEEIIGSIQDGSVFGSIALWPRSTAVLGMQAIVDAINGKDVPTTINVVNGKDRPILVDAAFLKEYPDFQPEWSVG